MTHQEALAKLEAKRARARQGGHGKVREKHVESGKLLVRQRLEALFDDGFEFEDGLLAGSERDLPGDGIVTVIGKIGGRDVAVIANDMTVKAGTWGPQALLKFNRMQDLALEVGIPLLYLVDSAGARIDQQKELFLGRNGWGNIWYKQVQISGRVPQVCVLFGPSPAGAAYVPGLCDLVIMVDKQASAYLGSPRMAKMTIFEDVTEEQMGGARLHCMFSGLGDVLVKSDAEGIDKAKQYLSYLPLNWKEKPPAVPSQGPNADAAAHLDTLVPLNQNVPYDVHDLIDGLVDYRSFYEIKELYAKEMTVGLARLGGQTVGVVANNSKHKGGVIFSDTSDKAARFIWMCNAYNVPLLFLQDVSGYMIGSAVEKSGIIRHGAKLSAVCEATVPRICVLVRKAYGGGYLAMSGAPTHPDAMLALPTAMPALVGPEAAVNAIHFNRIMELPEEERGEFVKQKRDEFALDIDVYKAAADPFAVEDVLPASRLREDLIRRYRVYNRREAKVIERRSAVHPV